MLNPSKVWLLVVLLTGIGWVGYIGVRALGPQRGLLVTGLAGGFVSATATTASMGRIGRTAEDPRVPLAGALAASLATFLQLLVVIAYVDPALLRRLWLLVVVGPPRSWSWPPSSTGGLDPIRTTPRRRSRPGGRSRFALR